MSETITIRPNSWSEAHTSNTNYIVTEYSNIAYMYDNDTETKGFVRAQVETTSTTSRSAYQYAYLKFSLSSIPKDVTVTQLRLRCNCYSNRTSATPGYSSTITCDCALCDGTVTIGASLPITKDVHSTYGVIITDDAVIEQFLASTSPRVRVRARATAYKKKSTASNKTFFARLTVYELYLEVTYERHVKLKVKQQDSWKDGTVKVKANDTWVDAKKIYAKVNGSWIET